jgi:hypothetical protein
MIRALRAAAIAAAVMVIPAVAAAQAAPKIVQADEAEWKPLSPKQTVGGPLIQVLWGNPLKREGGFLLKVSGEGELPRRTNSSSYTVVVVSGTWMHATQGGEYVEVRPGGHYTQRAKEQHRDRCVAGPDCVVVIRTAGKFDLKPVIVDTPGDVQSQMKGKKGR